MAAQLVHGLESMVEAGVRGLFGFADNDLQTNNEQAPAGEQSAEGASPPSASLIPPPRAARSPPATPGAIITTVDVPSGWIHLQSAYLDGQRKTRHFGLKNLTDAELEVEIHSDLGEQLAFWVIDDEQSSSSSSSASASTRSQSSSTALRLTVLPRSILPIGLTFQPSHSLPSTPAMPLSPAVDEGGFTPRVTPALTRKHSSDVSLPLTSQADSASEHGSVAVSESISSSSILSERSSGKKLETVYRAFPVHGSISIRATSIVGEDGVDTQRQSLALPFFASVCRSHFTLSLIHPATGVQVGHQLSQGELHVDFGNDAVVGGEYHRDLLLVNRSEIDLVWSTSVVNSKHSRKIWVSLRDLDSENVFGSDREAKPVPLPALSSRHLRLTLHVTEPVEDFSFDFVLSNLHQPGNSVTCLVTGSALALPVDDSLKILSGTTLDFGEICDGVWAKKMITCKNSGDKMLDVSFSSDPNHEVVYRLAGVAGEDMDDDLPRPAGRLKEKRSIEQLSRTSTRDNRGRSSRPVSPISSHGFPTSVGGDSAVSSHLLSESASLLQSASDVTSSDGRESMPSSRPPSRAASYASSHRQHIEDFAASDDDDSEAPFFSSGDPALTPASLVTPTSVPAPSAPTFMDTVASSNDLPNQIEEHTMRPGTEYRIMVLYRSPRDTTSSPEVAGALRTSSFRIYLDYSPASRSSRAGTTSRTRQTISCTAQSCTSNIKLATGNRIDFGEVTVGATKSAVISIANLSALSARVEIAAISKVLSTNRNVIIIPPFETVDEKVDFFPRRINDAYEKQLFVRNLLNRANDQLLEVRSKNVDVYNVTLHSHLYRILTPSGSNYLDFGSVVINCPSVRTIQFENLTASNLTLDVSASAPEDVELYARVEDLADMPSAPTVAPKYAGTQDGPERVMSPPSGELKERFMETMNDAGSKEVVKASKGKVAKAREKSVARPVEPAAETASKPSLAASVAAALKKGGRGRPVLLYGNAVVFKDRSLLEGHEYLDLASGPPVAAHRMSPRSKRTQLLDTIELEDKTKLSGQHPKIPKLDFAAGAKASGSRSKDVKPLRKKTVAASPVLRPNGDSPSLVPAMPPPSIQHIISSLARESSPALEAGAKSPALTAKRAQPRTEMFDPSDVTKITLESLLATFEQQDVRNKATAQDTPEADEQFVRRLIAARKELQDLISIGQLVPVTSLRIQPLSTRQIVVVMTPNGSTRPHISTRGKRSDSRLFIKLAEFDRRMLCTSAGAKTESDELPVRDLIVRSSCVRSVLEVQQSSINFGVVEKGETRSKTIVVHNRSDCIGVFRMRTSGSIASGNLKLGLGRYGVISAFGRKEVENFTFSPSLVGNFQETILVENVLDRLNNQNVSIKAAVRKQPSFACDAQLIDFGIKEADGRLPGARGFVITNTSKHDRVFNIEVGPVDGDTCAEISLAKDDKDSGLALSKGEEEELEVLLQKLKIARRKGKADKIIKYEVRLAALGVTQPAVTGDESEVEEPSQATTGSPQETPAPSPPIVPPAAPEKVRTTSLQVSLSPNQKQHVIVELLGCTGSADLLSSVKIYERKNTDEVLTVQISFKAKADE